MLNLHSTKFTMMPKSQKFKTFLPIISNKFVLTTLIFIVWLFFFDQNSILSRLSLAKNIRELKQQKEYLQKEISQNRENINELQSSAENLEKFAREEYMMKKADEDLYIVVED